MLVIHNFCMVKQKGGKNMGYDKPWEGYFKGFKILGNLYFVGTEFASTHIVDTGKGLIMFDSGYQHSLYLVIHNMHTLGLNPLDIKYIVHTHGHIDHFGATRALVELTGAKTFLGRQDREYANGTLDLSYAKEFGMEFNGTFEPDVLIDDGDVIELGNTKIVAVATPGHTPGTMSFLFNISDSDETYRVGLHGGAGLNTLCSEFLDKYKLPYSYRNDFAEAMDRVSKETVDIFLGNHMQQNDTPRKYKELLDGNKKAFVATDEWAKFCLNSKEAMYEMIKQEEKNKSL